MRTKINISIDEDILKEIDEHRKKTKQSRSRAIEERLLAYTAYRKDLGPRLKVVEDFIKAQKRLQRDMKRKI